MYRPLNTHWYYSYVDIPNLDTIKLELINLLNSSSVTKIHNSEFYTNVFKLDNCPAFTNYLSSKNLLKKFSRLLFSRGPVNASLPHVDMYNPVYLKYSLNIPVIDADDSYTVWYSTHKFELSNFSKYPELNKNPESNHAWIDCEEDATEICRARYTSPFLMNTTILHSGKALLNTRIICGIRFRPELTDTDIQMLGVNTPLVQRVSYQMPTDY